MYVTIQFTGQDKGFECISHSHNKFSVFGDGMQAVVAVNSRY